MTAKTGTSFNIHTLGPQGTNCEAAAINWLMENNINGKIFLHDTLEQGMVSMNKDTNKSVLLGCVVYPELHNLVFKNRGTSQLVECFVFPTMPMLLAARDSAHKFNSIASHPAPVALIPDKFKERILVNSNAVAAKKCANGHVDACITTEKSAIQNGLVIIKNYGPIPMGFTLHGKKDIDIKAIKKHPANQAS